MRERWKDIDGFVGLYQVSDLGRVRSLPRVVSRGDVRQPLQGKILSQRLSKKRKQPYLTVVLCRDGLSITRYVHRLVAQAFIPNPARLREVNHKDLNKGNCRALNLEWESSQGNKKHAVACGVLFNPNPKRGVACGMAKLNATKVRKIRKACDRKVDQRLTAKKFNVSQAAVSAINRRKTWTHIL